MYIVIKSLVPKSPFAVAVSGGVDSIVLAHVLRSLNYKFTIFHFNHNLRQQNEDMEESVKRFANEMQVPFVTSKRVRVALPERVSEARLRIHRMSAYRDLNMDVVTGHHLDDAIESYFMNCMTGVPMYKPIPTVTQLRNVCADVPNAIYRPMILTTKEAIVDYAKRHRLNQFVVEDETNTDERMFRNKVRHQICNQFADRGLHKIVKRLFYSDISSLESPV